jgi:hypothetical protein
MGFVKKWDSTQDGELSEATVRRKLDHPERYRISSRRCAPGASFPGTARAGTVYVIEGMCRYVFGDSQIDLKSGQYCDLPEGEFRLDVVGDQEVEIVRTWLLPEPFWFSSEQPPRG